MNSTQPPYYSSSFGDPTQHPNSSQPIGTQVGAADPSDPRTGPAPHTAGPHKSDIINKLDPRVDSDLSKQKKSSNAGVGGVGGAGADNTYTGSSAQKTAGPHSSDTGNKLDPRVDSDVDNRARQAPGTVSSDPRTGPAQTTAGPHESDLGNKVDSHIDSGVDNRASEPVSSNTRAAHAQRTAGPHDSDMGNKLDPRVDSDVDNRARHAPGTIASDARTGPAPRTAGPHSSDMGNKLDPRIDSDVDNRAQHAPSSSYNRETSHLGGTQAGGITSTTGPHDSKIGNKLDPRVDSDLDNRAQYAPGMTKTGNENPYATQDTSFSRGSNTGPHQSNMMNKLDPRVDAQTSDMSNKTTTQSHGSQFSGATRAQYDDNTIGRSTGTGFASSGVGYRPAESSGSAPGSRSAQKGANVGSDVKGVFAGAHGMGESLRGGLNAAVDKTFGHEEGVAKNDAIASRGEREMRTGNFSKGNNH
ncbi:protein dprC [Aspergillus alliaceus]|uniref:protein dprC n=1 Tax=Petromyces alliaceus TaxID=209559 RepID=UPI0012A76DB6|nr:uncharacterized protein BDW43DRAFT_121274 [Aspergillus alliaceus]KAB8238665.1 hypothetical protein BDW43DRAFT_121274 [Aspergillus alliaceus]